MCRHIYDWNIVNCDVKQPIQLNSFYRIPNIFMENAREPRLKTRHTMSLLPLQSFELHKILRAVRSGQFSAPAKFTYAPTTPSQSLAPLDESARTLGSARPTQKSWTLNHRCFTSFARAVIKRCTNFGGAVVSVLRADTGLLKRCRALKQRSTAVMNFGLALVWRCYSGTRCGYK